MADPAADIDAVADAAAPSGESEPNAISEEEVSALLEGNGGGGTVRPFDFSALRVNNTQMPMLETVCKSMAEKTAQSLSTLLNREVTAQFTALDTSSAAELQAALPVPASLITARLKPLPGNLFLSVDPTLLLTLIDGFFGGTGRAVADSQAAIAPASLRFQALLLRNIAAGVAAAWAPVTPVELELVKQETNPRLMLLGAPQDPLLALRFTVEIGGRSGRIDWLVPLSVLAPIREMLESASGVAPVRADAAWAPVLGNALLEAELDTRAILVRAAISLGELVRLNPGDIIPIEAPEQATLMAGDTALYRGRFGVSQGRNSLKILPGGL